MKRILYAIACMVPVMALNAQTGAGNILVSGNLTQSGSTTQNMDTAGTVKTERMDNSLQLGLRGGYFIADNFAVGLVAGYGSDRQRTENISSPSVSSSNDKRSSTIRFGAFARMYQMLGSSKFGVFGQVDLTYGIGSSSDESSFVNSNTTTTTETTGKHNELRIAVAPGVSYFFSEKFALEVMIGSLGYTMRNQESFGNNGRLTGKDKINSTHISLRPWDLGSINVGLTFFFGGGSASSGN